MEIYTIGFTQTTAERFFSRLADAHVKRLLDVRLNNTSQLAGFAKAKDLPYFARELLGCEYEHEPLLALLRENGGPFGPGALVELGEVTARPDPPETEDHTFATANARRLEDLTNEVYLAVLEKVSDLDIPAAFGPDLEEIRPRKLAVRAGHGRRSLAVMPLVKPRLQIEFDSLFLKIDTSSLTATIRVSDYRFYESDHVTIRRDVVNDVRRRISAGVPLYGMLGLARAVEDAEAGYVHWLMVNGLCLADRPVGDKP